MKYLFFNLENRYFIDILYMQIDKRDCLLQINKSLLSI